MAGSFGDYLENKLLDHAFNATTFTSPVTVYVGLSTTTPTDAGTNVTEPVGNAYARVAVTCNTTNFPAASGGAIANGVAITFPQATGSWGTVTHGVIYDAASAGNFLGWGSLTTSQTIDNLETASIAIGALDITLD